MKRYTITLPTPERCIELGIKSQGLATRTQLWLMGVASGVSYSGGVNKFNLFLVGKNSFDVECNSFMIINQVRDYLMAYGCITMEKVVPICCNFAFKQTA